MKVRIYCLILKKLFIVAAIALVGGMVMTSCSNDESDQDSPAEEKVRMFHLVPELGDTVNIFQVFNLKVPYEDRGLYKTAATHSQDSVVWKVLETGHSLIVDKSNEDFIWHYGIQYMFKLPGVYHSVLEWYRQRKFLGSDTITIQVIDAKPFLNWDFTEDVSGFFTPPLDDSITYYSILRVKTDFLEDSWKNGIFFMNILLNIEHTDEYTENVRSELKNYFTKLKGEPTYTETDDIDAIFKSIFGFDSAYYQAVTQRPYVSIHPEAIWITPLSTIVLMRLHYSGEKANDGYEIWSKLNP